MISYLVFLFLGNPIAFQGSAILFFAFGQEIKHTHRKISIEITAWAKRFLKLNLN